MVSFLLSVKWFPGTWPGGFNDKHLDFPHFLTAYTGESENTHSELCLCESVLSMFEMTGFNDRIVNPFLVAKIP